MGRKQPTTMEWKGQLALAPSHPLFTFSPFGLCCRHCKSNVTIQLDERSIQVHLKKHGMDSKSTTTRSLFEGYQALLENVRMSKTIEPYRSDNIIYIGFLCVCGVSFLKKGNAIRHCQNSGCDKAMIEKVELMKLCCGRYVSHAQVSAFFDEAPRITQQFDYCTARAALFPFLPLREKHDDTYTHMFMPLISGCGNVIHFVEKIKKDFISIHSPPNPATESLLVKLHQLAEVWLLNYAQKNIKLLPGNLRAALQTFGGGEIDEVSQNWTYTMQHDPSTLLIELKNLLSFAY
jgi:hypothetical protein